MLWLSQLSETTRTALFISFFSLPFSLYLSFLFLETGHRHGHRAYSYSIYKDYKLGYIFCVTAMTTETCREMTRMTLFYFFSFCLVAERIVRTLYGHR